MAQHQCPGPYRKEAETPQEVKCPQCRADMEIWASDTRVTCPSCETVLTRDELESENWR